MHVRLPFSTNEWLNCSIQLQINKNYMLILDPGVHIENPLLSTCFGSLPNNQTGPLTLRTLSPSSQIICHIKKPQFCMLGH